MQIVEKYFTYEFFFQTSCKKNPYGRKFICPVLWHMSILKCNKGCSTTASQHVSDKSTNDIMITRANYIMTQWDIPRRANLLNYISEANFHAAFTMKQPPVSMPSQPCHQTYTIPPPTHGLTTVCHVPQATAQTRKPISVFVFCCVAKERVWIAGEVQPWGSWRQKENEEQHKEHQIMPHCIQD